MDTKNFTKSGQKLSLGDYGINRLRTSCTSHTYVFYIMYLHIHKVITQSPIPNPQSPIPNPH